MTVLTVRDLEADTWRRPEAQAAAHGRSFEDEARAILAAAVALPAEAERALGSRVAARFAEDGLMQPHRATDPAPVVEFEA